MVSFSSDTTLEQIQDSACFLLGRKAVDASLLCVIDLHEAIGAAYPPPALRVGYHSHMKYCSECGNPIERRTPSGDHLARYMCTHCGRIHYQNPKVVTGCVPVWGDRLLLCRRAIEPRFGYWTFPAGYLELGETPRAGAEREALEETGVRVEVGELLAVISVPSVSQIYIVHRGRALSAAHHPTRESLETALMLEDEIPWDLLAFPTIYHSLRFFLADRAIGQERFHSMELLPPENRPNTENQYVAVNENHDGN